jgi:hypothetical protein
MKSNKKRDQRQIHLCLLYPVRLTLWNILRDARGNTFYPTPGHDWGDDSVNADTEQWNSRKKRTNSEVVSSVIRVCVEDSVLFGLRQRICSSG